MTPCDAPCPKCGSTDINRRFYARNERIENKEYGVAPCKWTTGQCYTYQGGS